MPKKEEKKNKKTSTASAKKKVVKKDTVKKVEPKKAVKPVEKKVTKEEVVTTKKMEKKDKKKGIIKLIDNTPFVIALCIIIILTGALIFSLIHNRIPTTKDGNEIIASIKGKKITADDLYKELKNKYANSDLINMIDTYIANKEAVVNSDDEAYVQEVVDYYVQYAESYEVSLEEFLRDYVGLSDIKTEDEFYEFVLEDYKKTIAIETYIGEKASDKEIKKHYEKNFSDTLTVKHILIQVDSEAKDAEGADEEAYNTAKKVINELKNTKKDKLDSKFEELVEEYSDDTATYSTGGLVENFKISEVEKEFFDASLKLKNGEYTTEPVKTTYGYHIILKVSSEKVEPLKEIENEVRRAYAKNELTNNTSLSTIAWDELRKEYNFKLNDDVIKNAYNKTIKEAEEAKTEE